MKIVFLGDSLTYGYGVSRNYAWVNILENKIDLQAINKGINGDTTGGMLARFQYDVADLKANVVHIMGGANDIICGATEDDIKPNIMAMVHQAQAYGIKPIIGFQPIGLGEDVPREWSVFADFDRLKRISLKYRTWLFTFCKAFGVEYIDYHEKIQERYKGDKISELFFDGLHFSEDGNELMSEIFIDYFRSSKQTE